MKLYSKAQVQEYDRRTIATLGGKGEILMELAGAALARLVISLKPRHVYILCGGGNNGGDGYVAARWLKQKGKTVKVIAYRDRLELKGEALWAYQSYERCGGEVVTTGPNLTWIHEVTPEDLVVDALLGTGVSPPLAPTLCSYLKGLSEALYKRGARVVACDLPSGIDPDTGEILAPPPRALITVTMGVPKLGLYCYPAREFCGKIEVVDLGYPDMTLPSKAILLDESELPTLYRRPTGHKGSFGTVGIIGGSKEMPGALALTCLGALRAGAGKVIAITEEGGDRLLNPEVIRRTIPTYKELVPSQIASHLNQCDLIVVGPGLGRDKQVFSLLKSSLKGIHKPLLLDADFLWCWGEEPWDEFHGKEFLITPHEGEAGRLLGVEPSEVKDSRLKTAQALSLRTQGIVLLKGAGSIIASKERVAVSPFATAALAIPGSGDLLAGVIAGLVAQGLNLWEATILGVYAHGAVGANPPLPLGNLASELSQAIAQVLATFTRRGNS